MHCDPRDRCGLEQHSGRPWGLNDAQFVQRGPECAQKIPPPTRIKSSLVISHAGKKQHLSSPVPPEAISSTESADQALHQSCQTAPPSERLAPLGPCIPPPARSAHLHLQTRTRCTQKSQKSTFITEEFSENLPISLMRMTLVLAGMCWVRKGFWSSGD